MPVQPKTKVGRNEPCPCQSGLKFKYCHGDVTKQAVCNRVANEKMVQLIREEQIRRGVVKLAYKCNNCDRQFNTPLKSRLDAATDICPYCEHTDIKENK